MFKNTKVERPEHNQGSMATHKTHASEAVRDGRNFRLGSLTRCVLLSMASLMLMSGCGPPSFDYLFDYFFYTVLSVVLLWLLLFIVLPIVFSGGPTLKVQGIYIIALSLLLGTSMLLKAMGWFSAYILSLTVAFVSGLIVAGVAWLWRKYDATVPHPKYAALFGFLLFFLLNFGYNVTVSEIQNFTNTFDVHGVGTYSKEVFDDVIFWEQLPYLSLLLSPLGVALVWFIDSLFRGKSWEPGKVIRVNLWALWSALTASIILISIVRGNPMSSAFVGLSPSAINTWVNRIQYDQLYVVVSDFRAVLFLISCHDLLVLLCLTVGLVAMSATGRLDRWRNAIAIGGAAGAVLLTFLPFYVGQESLLDFVVSVSKSGYVEQMKYREELMNLRALYPSSTALKHLLFSLTAGGALVFSLSLSGVSMKLGK